MDAESLDLELQQELQRFTTRFADRVTQATEVLERSDASAVRDEALRKNLLYVASAMEIATGPIAEVNLLDMVVFVRLSRATLANHWVPDLYGAAGTELLDVFSTSDEELSTIAGHVLSETQRAQLSGIVEAWLKDNPTQYRVEGIRLADFSEAAGSLAKERAGQAKGLLSSMKTATRAANQALLLTERGMFLVHRLPFLWRLQARLAARELTTDLLARVSQQTRAPVSVLARRARRVGLVALGAVGSLAGAGLFLLWTRSSVRS